MAFILKLLMVIAVTTAIAIATIATITTTRTTTATAISWDHSRNLGAEKKTILIKAKPRSRFLAQVSPKPRSPNAADHCNDNPEVCRNNYGGNANATANACCNNKCVDLSYDDKNCGACKNKCKFSQTCCRGECVYLAYDKRHCGLCNHRCPLGEFCVYGLCNYA